MTTTQLATLPPVERAIAALSFETVRAEVSKLATQYADITAISNKAGRDQAHAAAMTLKNRRVEIQRRAKEVREDAVAFQKVVIAKGDELAALIEPEEQRLLKPVSYTHLRIPVGVRHAGRRPSAHRRRLFQLRSRGNRRSGVDGSRRNAARRDPRRHPGSHPGNRFSQLIHPEGQSGPFGGIPSRRADCATGLSANATPGQITG